MGILIIIASIVGAVVLIIKLETRNEASRIDAIRAVLGQDTKVLEVQAESGVTETPGPVMLAVGPDGLYAYASDKSPRKPPTLLKKFPWPECQISHGEKTDPPPGKIAYELKVQALDGNASFATPAFLSDAAPQKPQARSLYDTYCDAIQRQSDPQPAPDVSTLQAAPSSGTVDTVGILLKMAIAIVLIVGIPLGLFVQIAGSWSSPTPASSANSGSAYIDQYGGQPSEYARISTSTSCVELQTMFDIAAANNSRASAGSPESKWTTGYMTAANDRMAAIGCY